MDGDRQVPPFHLSFSSGRGLLDARALWASVVGPHRLAMAQTQALRLQFDNPTLIHKNLGTSDVYVFLGVALPITAAVAPMAAMFSRELGGGFNNAAPTVLNGQMGGGGFGPTGFMQLLMPGEQLYGQITDPAIGAGGSQNVVVSKVMF